MPECLVVIYHNIASSRLGWAHDFKGVQEDVFVRQIAFLGRSYERLTLRQMIDHLDGRDRLPAKGWYPTFDDGYKDQLFAAVEHLQAAKIEGLFFLNTQRLETQRLLTVDKQRLLQYGTPSFREFLEAFCCAAARRSPLRDDGRFAPNAEHIAQAADFYAEFPFYSNEERFYRKVRDCWLTERQVEEIVDELFYQFFDDEAGLVQRYFMTWDDVRALQAAGMQLGGHSHAHPFLTKLDAAAQRADIRRNAALLSEQAGVKMTAFSYPFGGFNEDTIAALEGAGVRLGFTEDGLAETADLADPFRVSRLGPERISELMNGADVLRAPTRVR